MTKAINNTDDNGGGRGGSGTGGWVNTIVEEESNENAILPSHENLKAFVRLGWHISKVLMCHQRCCQCERKRKRLVNHGVDKKRLEGSFYRKRKKLIRKGGGLLLGRRWWTKGADEGWLLMMQQCRCSRTNSTTTTGANAATTPHYKR